MKKCSTLAIIFLVFFNLYNPSAQAAGFVFDARLGLLEMGKMGDGAGITDRDTLHFPLNVGLGMRFKNFNIGAFYEYAKVSQMESPDNYSGQNLNGSQSGYGVFMQFMNQNWMAGLDYHLASNYKFDQPNVLGEPVAYKGSGFSIQIARRVKNKFGIFAEFGQDNYTESETQALDPNVKSVRYGIGIIFSNAWGGRK